MHIWELRGGGVYYCRHDIVSMAKASKLNSLNIKAETTEADIFYKWKPGMSKMERTETPK
uniref:cytidine deaminase-like fold-containing protein n=1 Tax=Snodgrassella alvi TaxID=1196083 RepID=UPI003F8D5091